MSNSKSPCILYLGTFPPRECGIATFTQDLTKAIDKEFNLGIKSKVLAINDNGTSIYNYPRKVKWQIDETNIDDYLQRAKEINKSSEVKLVNIQHEYGIFGGEKGNYLLPFLEILQKPAIVTLHTVLPKPEQQIKIVTRSIAAKVNQIVVMTNSASRLLQEEYGVDKNKIAVIPHGVHHVTFPSKNKAKQKLNLSGYTILATFGMLNRDKGIEYAIEALPEVVKKFPKVLYLIIGATHPVIRRQEGERYRNKLKQKVIKLGLKDYVKFYNKYLPLSELIDYLKATDIYISPTLNPQQAVSGTISYALSCACPVIATANQYAQDVITPERGILVRFQKSYDIKKALLDMLTDKTMRKEMGRNSYFYSRHMTWQNVALAHYKIFNELAKIAPREKEKLPGINLTHIKTLTDDFGIIQFAVHTKPDIHSGYCLDDNVRALLAMAQYYQYKKNKNVLELIKIYLKFIKFGQRSNGRFYNFVNYNKTISDKSENEDSSGRALWALGYVMSSKAIPANLQQPARTMFKKAVKGATKNKFLRAISFSILGLSYAVNDENLSVKQKKEILALIKKLADKLVRSYQKTIETTEGKWFWFEDFLTYSNYKLPEALLRAYTITNNEEYLQIAEQALNFLAEITFEKKYFSPIGQDGWYFRNSKRAYFDQQPEDTASAVEALMVAYEVTQDEKYKKQTQLAFSWFLGKNHLNQMVYDEATGGCYDGLGRYSLNFNQGAESSVSYLLARLAMEKVK